MQPNPRLNQHFCPGSQDSATPWEENQQHTDKLKSQKRKIIWFNFKLFFSPCCPVQQCSESVSEMKIALLETFFYFFFLLFWGVAVQTSLESLCWQHNGIHRYPTPNPPDFPHVPIPHSSPCSPGATGKKSIWHKCWQRKAFSEGSLIQRKAESWWLPASEGACRNKPVGLPPLEAEGAEAAAHPCSDLGRQGILAAFSSTWRWLMEATAWVCVKCPQHWTFHTEGAFQPQAPRCCWNCLALICLSLLSFQPILLISCTKKFAHLLHKLLKHQLCDRD